MVELNEEAVERFFWFARERQAVYIRRRAGMPRPWTSDEILQRYRITNVYREQDKTTTWFRDNVRDALRDSTSVLLATVLFRWFNSIRSGETIFYQFNDSTDMSPWLHWVKDNDVKPMIQAMRKQGQPWITGAYMIRSPEGMDKLDGIVYCLERFRKARIPFDSFSAVDWEELAQLMLDRRSSDNPVTLQEAWAWFKEHYGLGPFLAYEIVTDLRHTALLDFAPDINQWANPGPGALRGAALMIRSPERGRKGRLLKSTYPEAHDVMAKLLELSKDAYYWPQVNGKDVRIGQNYAEQLKDIKDHYTSHDWRHWESREPEMWLCETLKYEKTRLGFGRPRGTFSK